MENELWNLKVNEYNMVAYTQRFNELAFMCPRMVEPESARIEAYIRGLSNNIKDEVTSSKPINLNEAVCMAHKIMPPKSAPLTQAVVRQMIKESVDAAIAAERARQVNARNNASGSGQDRGQVIAPVECTFAGFMKLTLIIFAVPNELLSLGDELQTMENELWNLKVKEYNMVAYTQRFNELALMCPRMVEPESAGIEAYIRGLSNNIKDEVTSSKPINLNEAVGFVFEERPNEAINILVEDEESPSSEPQGSPRDF
nr:reverse transcriptase domain-containing protein [Tanacetum cinerariifolium]